MCSETHQIATFKNFFPGKHAPEPPSKRLATPRIASPQKIWPPLANPADVLNMNTRSTTSMKRVAIDHSFIFFLERTNI